MKVLECKIDMIKTQAAFFVYFIINIIHPLQAYRSPLCNLLDMRAANSDGSRLRCPRRGEKKKKKEKRIPNHRCRRKKVLSDKKIVSKNRRGKMRRGF